MTSLEIAFAVLGICSFAATAWVCGVVAMRILRGPRA